MLKASAGLPASVHIDCWLNVSIEPPMDVLTGTETERE